MNSKHFNLGLAIKSPSDLVILAATTSVMFLWALCFPLINLSIMYAPLMQTAFLRALISGILLIILANALNRPAPKSLRDWSVIATIGLTATSLGFWGMFYAGKLISPGLATVLTNTQPLIASVLALFILKESITNLLKVGIVGGFIGVILIAIDSLLQGNLGLSQGAIYILIATIGIASSNILIKMHAIKLDIYYAMGGQLIFGSIPMLFWGFPFDALDAIRTNFSYTFILFLMAIPGTALPFLLWHWLLSKAPLVNLNTFSFLTPLFGLLLGALFFKESLSKIQWVGVSTIIIAVLLSSLSNIDFSKGKL